MANKTRHAFGTLEKIDESIRNGLINEFDTLFVKDANGNPYIGWIDENGNKMIVGNGSGSGSGVENAKEIIRVDELSTENVNLNAIYIYNNDMYIWGEDKFVLVSVNEETIKNMIEEYSDEVVNDVTDEDILDLFE